MRFSTLALLLASAAAGCLTPGSKPPGTNAPGTNTRGVEVPAASRKVVSAKQPPNRLIAHDGTVCTVSVGVYERTEAGMRRTCYWRHEG